MCKSLYAILEFGEFTSPHLNPSALMIEYKSEDETSSVSDITGNTLHHKPITVLFLIISFSFLAPAIIKTPIPSNEVIGTHVAYFIFVSCNIVVFGMVQTVLSQFDEKMPNKMIKVIENKTKKTPPRK